MKNVYSATGLVLLAILFLALTILGGAALQGMRIDLTEQGLYTLSPGTENILEDLEEPVTLEFYFSEEASSDLPMVRNFARRVQELLDEMAEQADGNLRVRRIDPEPFSEAEDQAASYGLEAVPVGSGGDSLYLGIVGTNMIDGLEVLPFISPAREQFLEYELARMVYLLSRPDKPRAALLSGIDMDGGMDMATGQRREPWAIHDQINEMFEVETVNADDEALPDELDVLVLVHPQGLSDSLLADIERFLAEGGRLLAFVDPYAESATPDNPNDPMAAMNMERSSNLEALFDAWGIDFSADRFVADAGLALQVNTAQSQRPVRHAGILGATADNMNADDVITGELDAVNLASVGRLELTEESPLEMDFLMQSSQQAGLMETRRLQFLSDPAQLMDQMGATGERYTLAARFSGDVPRVMTDEGQGDEGADKERASADASSRYPLNAIVVADVDMLADRYWVSRQRFFGTTMLEPFADNGDFVINAIDNLIGNADLISVRSRATSNRPFTLVESLRREAEQNLRATEQRLEAELAEAEQRLTELQQARGDTDLDILTEEQEAEIDRFMDKRLEIRRQLRQVRRELDEEIEALGTRIKIVNIALMPVLVTLFALAMAWRRRRLRRVRASREGGHA
ncbi:GldG family protein [Wenzhouxiangella sediminis]|uniref:ABC transporter n=1 Tax=Wenzhouxiangella sediminis TaxID=1792836 RepID=A0A3E1KBJ3_9GAMM|nr:Gldg family protein [Wenzhouxiangella sediminis]RFF31988.1 ABC transporter [Wenzhouxiangella sediminis]